MHDIPKIGRKGLYPDITPPLRLSVPMSYNLPSVQVGKSAGIFGLVRFSYGIKGKEEKCNKLILLGAEGCLA